MQIVSKISNLCGPDPDGRTTRDRKTALCTKVPRAVKTYHEFSITAVHGFADFTSSFLNAGTTSCTKVRHCLRLSGLWGTFLRCPLFCRIRWACLGLNACVPGSQVW